MSAPYLTLPVILRKGCSLLLCKQRNSPRSQAKLDLVPARPEFFYHAVYMLCLSAGMQLLGLQFLCGGSSLPLLLRYAAPSVADTAASGLQGCVLPAG